MKKWVQKIHMGTFTYSDGRKTLSDCRPVLIDASLSFFAATPAVAPELSTPVGLISTSITSAASSDSSIAAASSSAFSLSSPLKAAISFSNSAGFHSISCSKPSNGWRASLWCHERGFYLLFTYVLSYETQNLGLRRSQLGNHLTLDSELLENSDLYSLFKWLPNSLLL